MDSRSRAPILRLSSISCYHLTYKRRLRESMHTYLLCCDQGSVLLVLLFMATYAARICSRLLRSLAITAIIFLIDWVLQEIPLSDVQRTGHQGIIPKQSFNWLLLSRALAVTTHTQGFKVSSKDVGFCYFFFHFSLLWCCTVQNILKLFLGHLTNTCPWLLLVRCFWKWQLGSVCAGFFNGTATVVNIGCYLPL